VSDRRTQLLELLDQSGASLLALLTRLTLRQDVAEELMQDLFLRLSSAKDQGGIDCWYAYARRTAINLAFDWRRRQKIRQTSSLDESLDHACSTSSPLGTLIEADAVDWCMIRTLRDFRRFTTSLPFLVVANGVGRYPMPIPWTPREGTSC